MFPWDYVDRLLATKSEGVGLIVSAISFQDFQPMWSQITNVTDGQTDDMRSQDRALHYSASGGKKQKHNHYALAYTCTFRLSRADLNV